MEKKITENMSRYTNHYSFQLTPDSCRYIKSSLQEDLHKKTTEIAKDLDISITTSIQKQNMKQEFPKKWFIRITDENKDELFKYYYNINKSKDFRNIEDFHGCLTSFLRKDGTYLDYCDDGGNAELEGGIKITFEQFKENVLNMKQTKFKVGDILPKINGNHLPIRYRCKNWKINDPNRIETNLTILTQFNSKIYGFQKFTFDGVELEYVLIEIEDIIKPHNCFMVPISDLEKIYPNYKNNTTQMENKEIIGYKCPQDLFNESVKKGTVYVKNQLTQMYKIEGWDDFQLPKEIVETWEPVYQPKFKIGDWVWGFNNDGNGLPKKETLVQIVDSNPPTSDINNRATGLMGGDDWDFIVTNDKNYYRVNSKTAKFRLATQEEIDKETKIFIDCYEVKFPLKSLTTIDGYEFNLEFWKAAKLISQHNKAKIMVGCSKQFDVSLETINKILNRIL